MEYKDLLELVKKRRSIRHFENKIPSTDVILKIMEIARWAPSASNSQPWTFMVVTDKTIKEKIFEIVGKPDNIPDLPDPSTDSRMASRRRSFMNGALIFIFGDKRIGKNFSEKLYYSSLANVVLYINLAAASLNLGSKYVGQFCIEQNELKLKKLLNIPEDFGLYYTISIGYPVKTPSSRPVRELSEILHLNGFEKSKFLDIEGLKKYLERTIRY